MTDYVSQSSFGGGEQSPRIDGLAHTDQYRAGCTTLTNALITKFGGAMKRWGFQYEEDAHAATSALLIPMRIRGTGEFLLEFSAGYFRVWEDGELPASPETVVTYFTEAELADVQWAQWGNMLFLVHPDREPRVIKYIDGVWSFEIYDPKFTGPMLDPKRKRPLSFRKLNAGTYYLETIEGEDTEPFFIKGDESTAGGRIFLIEGNWVRLDPSDGYMTPNKALVIALDECDLDSLVLTDATSTIASREVYDWHGPWVEQALQSATCSVDNDADSGNVEIGEEFTIDLGDTIATDQWLTNVIDIDATDNQGERLAVITRVTNSNTLRAILIHGNPGGTYPVADDATYTAGLQRWELRDRWTTDEGIALISDDTTGTGLKVRASTFPGTTTEPEVFTATMVDGGNETGGLVYMNGGCYRIDTYLDSADVTVDAEADAEPAHPYPTTTWSIGWSRGTGYPRTVAVHQQRLWFGGVDRFPNRIYGSRVNQPFNFTPGPLDDDAVTLSLATEHGAGVQWMRSARDLMVGSEDTEYAIKGAPISASDIGVNPQTSYGGAPKQSLLVGNTVFFVTKDGKGLRELRFTIDEDGYASMDLAAIAGHLWEVSPIDRIVYMRDPLPVIFVLRENGTICALSYSRESGVFGWSPWTSKSSDTIKALAVRRPDGSDQDQLWVVRDRGGTRYVERMVVDQYLDHLLWVQPQAASQYITSDDTAGITHLIGESVSVFDEVDLYLGDFLVTDATPDTTAELPSEVTVVCGNEGPDGSSRARLGLSYTFTLTPHEPETRDSWGDSYGRTRRCHRVRVLLKDSWAGSVGGDPIETDVTIANTAHVYHSGWEYLSAVSKKSPSVVHDVPFAFELLAMNMAYEYGD